MTYKPGISIAMIAHNEAAVIGRSLSQLSWVDQIVVLDSGSSDDTSSIARQFTDEVYEVPNNINLNINKNISIDYCDREWVFVLDADEVIPYDLAGEIRRIIADNPDSDGYLIPRRNHVLGKWIKRGSQYPDHQLRLFRNGKGKFAAVHVHERIEIDGRTGKLDIPFDHHPYPDMASMQRKNLRDVEFEAQYLFENGKSISVSGLIVLLMLKIPVRFIRRYLFKGGIRDGVAGLIMVWFDAANSAQRWFRLWELTQQKDLGGNG